MYQILFIQAHCITKATILLASMVAIPVKVIYVAIVHRVCMADITCHLLCGVSTVSPQTTMRFRAAYMISAVSQTAFSPTAFID